MFEFGTSLHSRHCENPGRYLHDCSDRFRLERLPGGACTHWKTPPFHGAHPSRTSASISCCSGEAGANLYPRAFRTTAWSPASSCPCRS